MTNERAALPQNALLELAADHYNRYPGELVTLYLMFGVPEEPGTRLQIAMPRVMQPEQYHLKVSKGS